MTYDQLRTLSFQLVQSELLEKHTFYRLPFPEKWKMEIKKVQAAITNKSVDEVNIPITLLNKAMRALVPDLIYIEPHAAKSGEKPWLYCTDNSIPSEQLFLIIQAWLKTQFWKEGETHYSNLLKKLKSEDLHWEEVKLNVGNWRTHDNGTADLGSDNDFIILPHVIAAKFSQKNVSLEIGSEILKFRRAPRAVGSKGAELISWKPLSFNDNYWSVVITFTTQTIPFQSFPVLHCDLSLRCWVSCPITELPKDKETSVYLLTQVPWLEDFPNSTSFQVAPITGNWIKENKDENQFNYQAKWGSKLAALLDNLNPKNPFPKPQDIIGNPVLSLNLNGNTNAALVYRNGIKPPHHVQFGLPPLERRRITEKIAELLVPEWELVPQIQRVKTGRCQTSENYFIPNTKMKREYSEEELTAKRVSTIYKEIRQSLTVEIWYIHEATREELIKSICDYLGIPENAEFPYSFTEFTFNIKSQLLGSLGEALQLNSKIKDERDRRRDAIGEREKQVAAKVPQTSEMTVAIIELPPAERFQKENDPKNALRSGFAKVNRLTQFISTEPNNLSHRSLNSFLDLLRQLGVQSSPPKIVMKKASLPDKINYVGVWMIKKYAPTGADGEKKIVPVIVYMNSDSPEIQATAFGLDRFLPYREVLLVIAQNNKVKGFANLEQGMSRFIKPTLEDILRTGDTLLLCHAQNLRSQAWPWLANKNITQDQVKFGNEKPFKITRFKGLRIVRVRDSQSHETPEWYAPNDNEQGFSKGIFQIGERVFASTNHPPKSFSINRKLSKLSSWTKNGKTVAPSPDTYCWNPGLVELTVACIQPNDEIWPWAALTHELRHLALNYDEALKLPLPLYLAQQIEEYVLLLDVENTIDN